MESIFSMPKISSQWPIPKRAEVTKNSVDLEQCLVELFAAMFVHKPMTLNIGG